MADLLNKYLKNTSASEFAWGTNDCLTFVANWVMQRDLKDPMGVDRGTYKSRKQATRVLLRRGHGISGIMDIRLKEVGMVRTREPVRGSVGLVQSGHGTLGAICMGDDDWIMNCDGIGLLLVRTPKILKAWSFPDV